MDEIKEAIALAMEAQREGDDIGWFQMWPDGRISIEYQDFDIGKFITALEAAGYRISSATPEEDR